MKVSRFFIISIAFLLMALSFSVQAHADLYNRGTDSLGNRLIYDSDLDITWYDYRNVGPTWQSQIDWASALTVDFSGTSYDGWRLPTMVDGPWVFGNDGTTTAGYNITSSELGHLYYLTLGNLAPYDTLGNSQSWGFHNKGPFTQFQYTGTYWSSTESTEYSGYAWTFDTSSGSQNIGYKNDGYYGIAVLDGDVAIVPEPTTSILFVAGGAIFGFRRLWKKIRTA